jgi:colanic acid biosynthesis glycosyl transferase WcaI
MRVMFLTQWFDPEPAFKGVGFVRALSERGFDVEVVTGFPNYPSGVIYPGYRVRLFQREILEGVVVNRLPLYPSHDTSTVGRTLNYFSFFASALIYGLWASRRFNVVYAYHPPITVGAAAAVFGWITGTPFVLDVRDLWPESVAASGMKGTGALAKAVGAICDFVYRRAAAIEAPSRGIAATLVGRGVPADKVTTIYNWADEADTNPRGLSETETILPRGRFNIVYGGNIGRVQALDAVIEAARRAAESEPRIFLTLIGGGTEAERLRRFVSEVGASNVSVLPAVPKSHIADVFAAADVLLHHLADEPLFEITVSSKVPFYLAMGKPILMGVKGEARDLVVSAGAGVAAPPENIEALAEAMLDLSRRSREELLLMGKRGRSFYEQHCSAAVAIGATAELLGRVSLATNRPRRPAGSVE